MYHLNLTELKANFSKFGNIEEEAWKELIGNIEIINVKKGNKIIEEGKYTYHSYYLQKGTLIGYYTDPKGKEYVKSIFFSGDFPSAQASLIEGSPSRLTIEAVENCTLYRIVYNKFKKLIDEYGSFRKFYVNYLEQKWIIEREKKELSVIFENAQNRYLLFLKEYPGIDKKLKQKHIAAHLGITPTQLCRIKQNLTC